MGLIITCVCMYGSNKNLYMYCAYCIYIIYTCNSLITIQWICFKGVNLCDVLSVDILRISLECKYNKLLFGIIISSIEVSKQKLHISMSCLQRLLQRNQTRSASFLERRA